MASDLKCDSCGDDATFLIGNVQNGDQLAVCLQDAARWGLTMALSVLSPDELSDRLEELGGAAPDPGPTPGEEAAAPARPKRRRSRPAAQEQASEPAAGLAEAATPAPD